MNNQLNNPKVTRAWTMYDWANSVFSLTITTAIFPPYFEGVSKAAAEASGNVVNGIYYIDILGFKIVNSALYSYAISLGFLLVAIFNPILSGIADVQQSKKKFMQFFCYLGSFCSIMLYFFTPETLHFGILFFVLALFGFGGSLVFYNAFLPEIASEDQYDSLSAKGFSMGYIGSVLLLIINLIVILNVSLFFPVASKVTELLALDPSLTEATALSKASAHYTSIASRLAFVSVGLWWAGFAQITFRNLPERSLAKVKGERILYKGLLEIKKVWKEIGEPQNKVIKRYLIGFFFSAMGVQTVMYVASLFGKQELHMELGKLIATVLIIQLIAIVGAWGFAKISAIIGNIHALLLMLVVWIGITTAAYLVQTEIQFYTLAAVVGMVMGGIQSMFRSTFAKLIPDGTKEPASYFSFYDVAEKLATVFGTFVFGFINNYTENMRTSVLALIIFFILALFFIARIENFKEKHP
ncbi:MAG: MFS transporter [Sphingobacteriales bacterium]|jgi:UMF1 family MFS transporter|nr:MFS transporter [Sphingobacteriales bacterium]